MARPITCVVHGVVALCLASSTLRAQDRPLNVGFLLFPGVQIIDYAAPYEVFSHAAWATHKGYNVFTVAERLDSLQTSGGPGAARILPRYSFADHPKIDILVVPGGGGFQAGQGGVGDQLGNAVLIDWIHGTAKDAQIVMSVCNGALLLGKAGLLDGLSATTFWGMLGNLHEQVPTAHVVTDQRFVDNGKVITTAGLSSGLDGAFHVVDRLSGRGVAQQIALQMEYDWHPQAEFARAALPDMVLWYSGVNSLLFQELGGRPRLLVGTSAAFDEAIAVQGAQKSRDIFRQIVVTVAKDSTWRRDRLDTVSTVARGAWRTKDLRGRPVTVDLRVQPVEGGADSTIVRIRLEVAQVAARPH